MSVHENLIKEKPLPSQISLLVPPSLLTPLSHYHDHRTIVSVTNTVITSIKILPLLPLILCPLNANLKALLVKHIPLISIILT